MPLHKVTLPALGEGITDATIIRWLVEEGDYVHIDQPLVEIATDKVDSEVYSPFEGVLKKIIALAGDIPRVGETLAFIQVGTEEEIDIESLVSKSNASSDVSHSDIVKSKQIILGNQYQWPFIPPFIETAARKLNIQLAELVAFTGKSKGDMIDKTDLQRFVQQKPEFEPETTDHSLSLNASNVKTVEYTAASKIETDTNPDYERVPLSRIRKKIAENMLLSSKTIPHVTSFIEVDATNMVEWREKNKETFYQKYGTKLTLTHLFVEAIVYALKVHPTVNVSIDGDDLILKKNINIGMATVLPDGNLIVPVIKDADKLSLEGIAHTVNDLSNRARNNELKPAEIFGSTFTFTNIGVFGSLTGTPLINLPEAAILGIGAVQKKPWAIKTSEGYALGFRDIIVLSLAYDHRIIDGSLGGLFLKTLKDYIEEFNIQKPV